MLFACGNLSERFKNPNNSMVRKKTRIMSKSATELWGVICLYLKSPYVLLVEIKNNLPLWLTNMCFTKNVFIFTADQSGVCKMLHFKCIVFNRIVFSWNLRF